MEKITVIKATKRSDLWNFDTNEPIEDTTPIGFTMTVEGAVPESYIKWVPNKIFDRRKYPELYAMFGKDHLPNDIELKCFVQKHWDKWHCEKTLKKSLTTTLIKLIIMVSIMIGVIAFIILH